MFRFLNETLSAYQARDPAARSKLEIFLLYPGVHATIYYKIAHFLYRRHLRFLARCVSQWARRRTGIEIHPGATIGRRLVIDHGMGIVIGETAAVGNDVLLYQGVTLGGTGKDQGKRHPTIGNNVLIGSGAENIGRARLTDRVDFRVGDGARIAANAVVLQEVPGDSTAVGVPAHIVKIAGERVAYANTVDQINITDPVNETMKALLSRVEFLERQLDERAAQNTDENRQEE